MSVLQCDWVVVGAPAALKARQERGAGVAHPCGILACVDLSPNSNPPLPPGVIEDFHGHVFMMFHLLMSLNDENQDEKDISLNQGRG